MKINLLPKKEIKNKAFKLINIFSMTALIFNMSMVGVFIAPKVALAVITNPDFSSVTWSPYQLNGHTVTDFEDNVCGINDYSKGPANVAPDSVDLASNAQVGPPCLNPGTAATLQTGSDVNYLYFRIRLDDTPISSGGGGKYLSYHWDVLIDTDGNNTSDYVVDLNGSGNLPGQNGSSHSGILGVYTNDPGAQTYDPANFVWQTEASATTDIYTHVQATTENASQYWLDFAVPKASVPFSSYVNLFASTSASNTNPLQKDWMASEAFFIELVKTKSVVNLTHPGYTTVANPARPGDVLRYTLTVINNGNIKAPGFVVSDDVSDIVQYTTNPTNFNPATGTYNSTTKIVSWPQTDILPGNTLTDKFEVTVKPMNQWPTQGDFTITNVYGNEIIVPFCSLIITKQVDKTTAVPGDTLTYTINYENPATANCTGTGVKIYDQLDSYLTYVNGTLTGTEHNGNGDGITLLGNFNGTDPLVNANVVIPGESGTITFQAVVSNSVPCDETIIPNEAKIWSNETGDLWSNEVNTTVNKECYGSVKVNKLVDTNGDGTFEGGNTEANALGFRWGLDSATPDRNMGSTADNILPGAHTVNENSVANYHFVGWYPTADTQHNCANPQGNTLPANINVYINQTTEITLCNARDTGSLKVYKYIDAGTATADQWDFSIAGHGTLTPAPGQNYVIFNNLPTGNYDVTESNLPDYHMVSTTCNNVAVNKNTQSECNFHNTRDTGNLIIHKEVDTDGDGDIDLFDPAGWTWDLDNVNTNYPMGSTQNVFTGNHTVKEDQQANYHSIGWYCTDQTSGSGETLNVDVPSGGVSCTFTNVRDTGRLTVIKHMVGGSAQSSDWTMHIKQNSTDIYTFPGAESPGVTKTLVTGAYKVEESNGPPDYTLTYSGDCDSSGNVTINKDDNKTCVLTNTRDTGRLTVIKHVVGGTGVASDWTMHIDNLYSFPGSEAGETKTLDTGSYNVYETDGLSDYTLTYSGDCDANGDVTINKGDTKTCTLTNTRDTGTLIVKKHVINDNGGTLEAGDFTMYVSGGHVSNPSFPGNEAGTAVTLDTGSYNVTESVLQGYADSYSADCSGTIAKNETKTCTITNDDIQPLLTVTKIVINDNGGNAVVADFPLFVDLTNVVSGVQNGFNAGNHVISETQQSGYVGTISGDCDSQGNITLNLGDVKACTITNDDIGPTITLYKLVNNNHGGNAVAADFTLKIDGNGIVQGVANPVMANVAHSIDEDSVSGYEFVNITGSEKCPDVLGGTATLDEGENITCLITNQDIAPTITLNKVVNNNHGGNAGVNDFGLTIGGTPVNSGQTLPVNSNTPYALNEAGLSGYHFASLTGDEGCPNALGGTVTLDEGENINCTITNEDEAPTITLIKNVINDNGGNAGENDFGLTIGGTPVTSGQTLNVNSNEAIALDEAGLFGYNFVSITGDAKCPSVLGGTVTLDEGENITCTITNDDQEPTITLYKEVINDNGGNAGVNDFGLTIGGTPVNSGQTLPVDANTPYALNEVGLTGYSFVEIYGDPKCPSVLGGTVTLDEGENITCTIKNDDQAPTITLNKVVNNNHGGNAGVNDFGLTIGAVPINSGQTLPVDSNTPVALNEAGLSGYHFVSLTGNEGCPEVLGGTVTLDEGENINCTITNEDEAPTITLIKNVINDNGGNAGANDFGLTIGGTPVNSGQTLDVNSNEAIALNEAGLSGYAFVDITGDEKCPSILGGTTTLDEGEDITCTITNDDIAPTITLYKSVINNHGGNAVSADFTLKIDGNGIVQGVANPVMANVAHSIDEDSVSGYEFVSITGSEKCPDVLGGTATLDEGENITCLIYNQDIAPTITLNKVVNNNHGGNAGINDFGLTIGGVAVNSGQTLPVNSNTPYALNEAGLSGYHFASLTGDEGCPNALGGTVTLDEGKNITCTITNEDEAPTITLIKNVINDNGGNAGENDFGLTIGGTPVNSGQTLDVNSNEAISLNEAGLFGYSFVSITGDAKCPAVLGGTVTLDEGEDITCTITNNDISPELTIIKHVVNDNGGLAAAPDFTMNVTGTNVSSPSFAGDENGTTVTLDQGSYSVDEDFYFGYAKSLSADCSGTINVGETKTCTITNDDIQPLLTVTKVVINDNGGTKQVVDFPLFVNQTQVTSGIQNGFDAGNYLISETNQPGYAASFSGDCDNQGNITLNVGDVKSCTITNDDETAHLILEKFVTNDNGGTELANAWTLTADGPTYISGQGGVESDVDAGTYTLSESGPANYTASNWNCEGGYLNGDQLTLGLGESAYCSITNDDIQPKLTVTKIVVNDNGRTKQVDDFPLFVDSTSVTSGVQNSFDADTYIISETNQYGYVATITGDCAADGAITLNPGDVKSCTITNNDTMPILGLTKTAPAKVNAGDNITYTINWSISGNAQATQVVLTDPIPANTTFVSADNSGAYDAVAKKVTWDLGTKNPGDSGTVHMIVKTSSPLADGTIITNIAYLDSFETDPALQAQAQTEIVSGPILNIVKLDTPDPVKPGENINFTINWSISGNDSATNVIITDVVPTNTTFVSVADGGVYNEVLNTVSWTLGDKNPGDSGTVHFVVKVDSPLPNGTVILNTAVIDCDETEPTSADADTTVNSAPVLTITKTVDKTFVNPGKTANYTVVIENIGNETAYNVKLTDLLPSGFTYTEFGTSTHTWSLGDLAAGAKVSITYNVTIDKTVKAGDYENLAVASADNHPNVTDKAPLEVRIPKVKGEEAKPNLTIEKSVDVQYANPGNTVKYTVKVTNKGDATAENVKMQDVLPAGFTFLGSTNVTKIWALGDLKPGESKEITYEVKIDSKILTGKYENLAIAWADNNDKVSDFVSLEVRTVKVLAETGPAPLDFIYFFGAGTILLSSLYVLRLTNRKKEK